MGADVDVTARLGDETRVALRTEVEIATEGEGEVAVESDEDEALQPAAKTEEKTPATRKTLTIPLRSAESKESAESLILVIPSALLVSFRAAASGRRVAIPWLLYRQLQ